MNCECPLNAPFINENSQCVSCPDPGIWDKSRKACFTCPKGFFYDEKNGVCICPSDKPYLNANNVCVDCL